VIQALISQEAHNRVPASDQQWLRVAVADELNRVLRTPKMTKDKATQ
jgi:hypothetical protein